MKKINISIAILFFIFCVYSLINIKETNQSAMNVLITFSKTILPALLPFLILNQLLIKLGIIDFLAYLLQFISYPLFKISGKGASIILIGILNGFPSSAIFASIMLKEEQITKQEAQRLVNYIFFPSISFLFAIIQNNLNNNTLFIYLLLSIYLTGFSFLYLSSFKANYSLDYISFKETISTIQKKLTNLSFIKELKDIISYASITLINILGIIILCSIPCNIISKLINNDFSLIYKGLIEFSIPSIELSLLNVNKKRTVLFLSTILSFSGLSSIMQASLFISDASLNAKQFILNRIIISFFSSIILLLFFSFL